MTSLSARWALVLSFLISSAGLLILSGVAPGDSYASGVLPGMLVTSLGCGLSLPVLTAAAVTGTTGENAGLGSAVFSSGQQIGGAVGVAVLVTVAGRHSFSYALIAAAGLLVLGAGLVAALLPTRHAALR